MMIYVHILGRPICYFALLFTLVDLFMDPFQKIIEKDFFMAILDF